MSVAGDSHTHVDRFKLAAQGVDNGLWDWDLTTNRIHYSSMWIFMLGFSEMEFGNTSEEWFKRIHPEDLERVRREIETHLEKGSAQFEIQHRMLHQNGCYRWMTCRGVITRDETGRAMRITGFHTDITAEAVTDPLTGLPNRLLLLDRLTRSIEKSRRREDFLFAVLIVNLGLFESGINRLETENSDLLIIAAARRLETALMAYDSNAGEGRVHLLVRSGGEDFIILLDGLSEASEGKKVAERLLKEISAPFGFCGREVFLSASIGLTLSATGYRTAEEALRDADTAAYRAKSFGKPRCEVFDTAILESLQMRHQLEQDLRMALGRNEILVFYQPIVSLFSSQVVGFEALARWRHPSRGMLLPAEFIPVAEKTGIIIPLNRWILQQACRQLKAWQENPRVSRDLWISVNLSGMQFTHPSLASEIGETLRAMDLNANCLILELTEGSILENLEAARNILMQLHIMGTRIALDDFGTGCSALAYVHQLPLDCLKLDLSFVRSIEKSPDTQEIVRAVSVMAKQLGLHVIAEGIENTGQLEWIRSLNIEYGQGFLFSKAVISEEAEILLLNGFASGEEVPLPLALPEKSGAMAVPLLLPAISPDASNAIHESQTKRAFAPMRKYAILGLAILGLLLAGGLLARWNRWTAPPAVHTAAPGISAKAVSADKAAAAPVDTEMSAAQQNQKVSDAGPKMPAATPAAARKTPSEAVYKYPVVHDHRLGNCKGTLKVSRDTFSYIAEKGKDSFSMKYSELSFALDGDQLLIKTKSRDFRFRSADARTREENRSLLSAIYQNISRFHTQRPRK